MSKQINNALSISRESGTSVKLDTHCFTQWPSQHPNVPPPPTNKMTDSNFKLVLGKIGAPKDQQLFPSLLPPQLYKSQQGSRGRWCPEAGLPPQGASQAQGETGLCDCQQVRRVLFQKQLPWGNYRTRTWTLKLLKGSSSSPQEEAQQKRAVGLHRVGA